jgi:hemerythrin-like domain-containing protein
MGDTKPLKRHPALVPLSKDHHFGLLLCWKIRTGIKKGISTQRMVDYVNYFFNDHLKPHFLEEEQHIFVLLDSDDEKRKKAESQHIELIQLIDSLTAQPHKALETLGALEQELDNHIRFEERDLFPYIQSILNEAELEKLKGKIESIHQTVPDDWNDPFWLN